MRYTKVAAVGMFLLLVGCQPAPPLIPTVAVLPAISEAVTVTPTVVVLAPTAELLRSSPTFPVVTFTPTPTATFTHTPTPTPTFTPTFTNTPTPTPTPRLLPAGVKPNWTPQIQDFDGVTMVLVPAGCFRMGSDNGDSDEKPAHDFCLDQPFWIDKFEVSQAQFRQFGGKAANASYFKGDNLPRERITWFEARDFCAQRDARLPSEAEWEYAARGPEGLIYPWGNTFEADKVVYVGNSNRQSALVGSRPGGVSWVGALDMSGNVWEWVSSLHQAYPYQSDDGRESTNDTKSRRVLRGGGFSSLVSLLRAALRYGFSPGSGDGFLGFRCARSYH